MPTSFLAPPNHFYGRDEFVARFKSRLEHYNFFIYEGILGSGTTSLARRLLRETKAVGLKGSLFLRLVPGEGVNSILARVEALTRGKTIINVDRQGDPFCRLIETLNNHKLVLLLDGLEHFRKEDLPALVRSLRAAKGSFRVIATSHGEPELSAMDAMLLHKERVGQLSAEETQHIALEAKLEPVNIEALTADAARGGACAQPLTLRFIISLCGNVLPPKELLEAQTARSVNAFRAIMAFAEQNLKQEEKDALNTIAAIGEPVSREVAVQVADNIVTKLLAKGLLDDIDGDVYIHQLTANYFGQNENLNSKQAIILATHLAKRGQSRCEPVSLIRAGKLLAQAEHLEQAVATLSDSWDTVRDLGFGEAYLRIIASIPATGTLAPRLALLSAQARIRQGTAAHVREELEKLAKEQDGWTRIRALAALISIYDELENFELVVKTFEALRKESVEPELLIPVGPIAAAAMVKLGHVAEAEKLGKTLLQRLKTGKDHARHGELHRLLSQVYAQMGNLATAIKQADLASKSFDAAGDLYHAATAVGFIGDLYRETGDFELAQAAFKRFHELAQKWGDRNLIQIAELTEAWVALDIGDLTSAQKNISLVERNLSATASRRLRRYLAAAKALLEVGRGRHEAAAEMLPRVVEMWDASGPRTVADMLRTHLIRSYIAINRINEASRIVDESLARLDPKTAAPRVAMFLRESALIRLRRKDSKQAIAELSQACKLFNAGGNRREESHTLYRIAHAAFEEGEVALAKERAKEALALANRIKHSRVVALGSELLARISLYESDIKNAVSLARNALAALKRLGDEIGTMHVSELLLAAQIISGDLSSALRLGPRLAVQADALGVREVRIRAIALTGVALIRKGNLDAAQRCFREIPDTVVSQRTSALMWRFGESLAQLLGNSAEAAERCDHWVATLHKLTLLRQNSIVHSLEQLELPPRQRCQLYAHSEKRLVGNETASIIDINNRNFVLDLLHQRGFFAGKPLKLPSMQAQIIFAQIVDALPSKLTITDATKILNSDIADPEVEEFLHPLIKELQKAFHGVKDFNLEVKGKNFTLKLPHDYIIIIPMQLLMGELNSEQQKILKILRRGGDNTVSAIAKQLKITLPQTKKVLETLIRGGIVDSIRKGGTQVYRVV
ncbi:MAG: hypothetical protein JW841_10620 [Deltaproteobacteria bacterium]|nr:hypothetical protein [Deltaproteobacteria bacterium]